MKSERTGHEIMARQRRQAVALIATTEDRPTRKPEDRAPRTRKGALPPVAERVTFLVHQVNARIAQACNIVFKQYGVDIYSSRILALLLERSELRVGDLVDLMVLPQSTISHQLQRLEKQGLIRRRRTLADNRSVIVTLTAFGKRTAEECNELSVAVYTTIVAEFDPKEIQTLRHLLTKMFGSLDHFADRYL